MKLNISPSGAPLVCKRVDRSDCIKPLTNRKLRIPAMFAGERRKIRSALLDVVPEEFA